VPEAFSTDAPAPLPSCSSVVPQFCLDPAERHTIVLLTYRQTKPSARELQFQRDFNLKTPKYYEEIKKLTAFDMLLFLFLMISLVIKSFIFFRLRFSACNFYSILINKRDRNRDKREGEITRFMHGEGGVSNGVGRERGRGNNLLVNKLLVYI
jgi:hypothetical protein